RRAELEHIAASLGIADRVGFTGFVRQSDAALRALDIVVHASTSPEPFGLVVAEAMACGRAVIVSRAGGAAELVTAGVDALPHAPGNIEELSARMATLIADAGLRARLSSAARQTAEKKFELERLARELVPVYAFTGWARPERAGRTRSSERAGRWRRCSPAIGSIA